MGDQPLLVSCCSQVFSKGQNIFFLTAINRQVLCFLLQKISELQQSLLEEYVNHMHEVYCVFSKNHMPDLFHL